MNKGASEVASSLSLNESYGDILTGIVLFFLIGCEFFINYRVIFRKKNAEVSEKKEA
jgi:simple sugar transport system permease protein